MYYGFFIVEIAPRESLAISNKLILVQLFSMMSKALSNAMASVVNVELYSNEDNVKTLSSATIASPVLM